MNKINKKNNKSIKALTKVKKVGATISLIAVLASGITLAEVKDQCKSNIPVAQVCPITILETKLFGFEFGLKHHMKDLENFNYTNGSFHNYVDDISLIKAGSIYSFPLVSEEVTKDTNAIERFYPLEKGTIDKEVNSSIIRYSNIMEEYDQVFISNEAWTYENGQFVHEYYGDGKLLKR